MRVCIFSDIHGNIEALNKMYEAEYSETDFFIFAGDIFGYFYEQSQIIDILMSDRKLFAVMGNHDFNYIQFRQTPDREWLIDRYGSSYNTSLSKEQLSYLTHLPDHLELTIDGKHFGIFHGGFQDHLNQRIYPDTPPPVGFPEGRYDYFIIGHTHYGFVRREGAATIINPGSLGQPRDQKGFGYCILNVSNGTYQFKTVDVDTQALLDSVAQRDAGRSIYSYLKQKLGG